MCNKFKNRVRLELLKQAFSQRQLPLAFPEGPPNQPDEVKITDRTTIIRPAAKGEGFELIGRPWGYQDPRGFPVPVWRAGDSRSGHHRCVAVTDGYYEYTPQHGKPPKGERKTPWLFTMPGQDWFFLAGAEHGDAFVILSTEPGPDTAPIHDRQMAPLTFDQGVAWLQGAPAADLARPLPAGALQVTRLSEGAGTDGGAGASDVLL